MADQEQLELLRQGKDVWNEWRTLHQEVNIDLNEANLIGADLGEANLTGANLGEANLSEANLRGAYLNEAYLRGANLRGAYLSKANLSEANLSEADFSKADLSKANLSEANLSEADFSKATLSEANLRGAYLSGAYLSRANLSRADLSRATLIGTNLSGATLSQCIIYGISVWNAQLNGAKQENLRVTDYSEPSITVDNLEVAQFIYLLLNNDKIRDVINTITTKVVLILGRFTPERKQILDALREELRTLDYLPILFDFEKPTNRDFTETISTLAHLARFIIADLTDPRSIPQELQKIVPILQVPVQPILFEGNREHAMFVDFYKYPWVLPIYFYTDQGHLLATLKGQVIEPAEQKAKDLEKQ
jgi:uncharacterized protein YjbI with pentapeptide repeats